jgi:hypothetical protein
VGVKEPHEQELHVDTPVLAPRGRLPVAINNAVVAAFTRFPTPVVTK